MARLASKTLVHILSVSFVAFFFCVVPTVSSYSSLRKLYLNGFGPDSSTFDSAGDGPYATIADGRILKYEGPTTGFVVYAYTSQNRPAKLCDGTNITSLAQICGRGLGLGFSYKTGKLFIATVLGGLGMVQPGGGVAKVVATSADGVPFKLPDAVEVDQNTGYVYFTDLSGKYNFSQIKELNTDRDASGRLLKYDPETEKVTVLLRDLAAPAGVAVSADSSYLLVTELLKNRVQKYWLKGPKANTAEVLLNLSGSPDNIKKNEAGDFWIAVTVPILGTGFLQGQKISGNGTLLQKLTFSPEFSSISITEVNEHKGNLYLGTLTNNYIGVKQVM